MRMRYYKATGGFTFVEAIVVAALSALIFGALFASFQYSLQLINNSRAKLSALSVANDRMEFFRSLPYDDVGTIAGIPAGTIPQNSTTTLNGIEFQERVLVEYVDDPADGQDTATTSDSNGIPSDYKRIKVEYTWQIGNATSSISLISNIVPRSIETTAGGGTAKINVIDENSALLPGASVRLINNTTTSTIDVTRTTDAGGVALFSGAPAASDYEVIVTANIFGQYSTDQTYVATTSNPNPSVAPFAVLEADISTLTFQIGELSDMELATFSAINERVGLEEFFDMSGVAAATNATTTGGDLVLTDSLGVYDASGNAYLNNVTPSSLENWEVVRVVFDDPANTSHSIQFYTGAAPGSYTLIPDTDLPGNSTGFSETLIDISDLDPSTYPSLVVGVNLDTTDTSETPEVNEIGVYYRESVTALPSIDIDLQGTKVIGTDLSAQSIYKYDQTVTTDGTGDITLSDMEFDTYTATPPAAYDIATACTAHPIVHEAGIDSVVDLVLVSNAPNTLRVEVVDSLDQPIPGATVNLNRTGYDVDIDTNICGQAFFTGGVSDNNDYRLTVSALGYTTAVTDPFDVSGDTVARITLVP